jgi:hypothetical protein
MAFVSILRTVEEEVMDHLVGTGAYWAVRHVTSVYAVYVFVEWDMSELDVET